MNLSTSKGENRSRNCTHNLLQMISRASKKAENGQKFHTFWMFYHFVVHFFSRKQGSHAPTRGVFLEPSKLNHSLVQKDIPTSINCEDPSRRVWKDFTWGVEHFGLVAVDGIFCQDPPKNGHHRTQHHFVLKKTGRHNNEQLNDSCRRWLYIEL